MTRSLLVDLPQDAIWHKICQYLAEPDVDALFATDREHWQPLFNNVKLWNDILCRDGRELEQTWWDARASCQVGHACAALTHVHWHFPYTGLGQPHPDGREGHQACLLQDRYIVLHGGFSSDKSVWVQDLLTPPRVRHGFGEVLNQNPPWHRIVAEGDDPGFCYGSTLTVLDDWTMLRFGGFRSGGYMEETADLCLLRIVPVVGVPPATFRAVWQNVTKYSIKTYDHLAKRFESGSTRVDISDYSGTIQQVRRAYHSAIVLWSGSFLLVFGGMQGGIGSIAKPALLDYQTWTWYVNLPSAPALLPPPRHGHSMFYDAHRSRILIFGGATGSNLLHTGHDLDSVYELPIPTAFVTDMIWEWKVVDWERHRALSAHEKLNLGRCHAGHQVARDKVLFAFGSSQPSTNGVLVYDLAQDAFVPPIRVSGEFAQPRFTGASVFLKRLGYMWFHGGFLAGEGQCTDEISVLDLAAGWTRPRRWELNMDTCWRVPRQPYEAVLDSTVAAFHQGRYAAPAAFGRGMRPGAMFAHFWDLRVQVRHGGALHDDNDSNTDSDWEID